MPHFELQLRSGNIKRLWAFYVETGKMVNRKEFEDYMRSINPKDWPARPPDYDYSK